MSRMKNSVSRRATVATILVVAALCAFVVCACAQETNVSRAIREVPRENITTIPEPATWRVFLVGAQHYRQGIPKLQYTDNDVEELRKSFIQLGVNPDNMVVMVKGQEDFDLVPTKDNIERQFQKFVGRLDKNSLVFCYLSGHGFSVSEPDDSEPGKKKVRSYFAPLDAERKMLVNAKGESKRGMTIETSASSDSGVAPDRELSVTESLCRSSVSIDDMLALLAAAGAHFTWFNVDACAQYLGSRDVPETDFLNVVNIPPGALYFQGCEDGKYSYEGVDWRVLDVTDPNGEIKNDPRVKHGLFTKSLIEALNHYLTKSENRTLADANTDGEITLREVVNYVQTHVDQDAVQYFRSSQKPQIRVNKESVLDDFILFKDLPVNGFSNADWNEGRSYLEEARRLKDADDLKGANAAIRKAQEKLRGYKEVDAEARELQTLYDAQMAQERYKKAQDAFNAGRFEDALAEIKTALDPTPNDPEVKRQYEEFQSKVEAELAKKAEQEKRKQADSDYEIAVSNFNRGRIQLAYDDVNNALKLFPNDEKYKAFKWQVIGRAQELGIKLTEAGEEKPAVAEPSKPQATETASAKPESPPSGGVSESNPAPEPSSRKAGSLRVITIAGVKVNFRWCPAGEFMMGSPSSEAGRYDDETQHKVKISRGFWLAETETTQELWHAVMGANPSRFKGADLPVEQVSWDDCQEFIKKLNSNARSGLHFQLPSEAHWEYACRAGTRGAYNVSGASLDSLAWCSGNSDSKTHKVGTKKANAWGFYDMFGNVWEWCSDWYGGYPSGDATDPTGPKNGSSRVYRGGCWYSESRGCRSADRDWNTPVNRLYSLGFRLELTDASK